MAISLYPSPSLHYQLKADPCILKHSDSIPLASSWVSPVRGTSRRLEGGKRNQDIYFQPPLLTDRGFLPVAPAHVKGPPVLTILLLGLANMAPFLCSLKPGVPTAPCCCLLLDDLPFIGLFNPVHGDYS